VRFTHEDDAWSVVAVRVAEGYPGAGGEVTAVGALVGVQPGEHLRLTGRWRDHVRWGRQLEVESCLPVAPSTATGMERYLGSGLVKGIGPELAARIVQRFGTGTFDVLDHHPERLSQVEGIGRVRVARIREAWTRQRGIREVMVFLQGHGISPALAARIWKRYGTRSPIVLRENPYVLAEEVAGIAFPTADAIARKMGVAADAPERLEAAALHALSAASGEGHVWQQRGSLAAACARLTGAGEEACRGAIEALAARGAVAHGKGGGGPLLALPRLASAEQAAAEVVARLAAARPPAGAVDAAASIAGFEQSTGIALSDRQREAVRLACASRLLVITGGPGTGKTTLVRAIVEALRGSGRRVLLCAPTGRAAKRLAEATGREAKTIHRLLEYSAGGFKRDAGHRLDGDAVIVDETSMVDVELFRSLLDAMPPEGRLILVGDKDQLPSVGPGAVLADLIGSGIVPVVRLDEIFRQARTSAIVVGAHEVNAGRVPSFSPDDAGDFYFVERADPERAVDTILDLVANRIPRRFGLDPRRDLQVLVPMQRGALGVANLNRRLQELLTPPGPAVERGSVAFRAGDRVMQVRNDYERDVYNGDLAEVARVDPQARTVSVRFDNGEAEYDAADLDDLALAWASTIHKSQGGEFPGVIVALHTQHYVLLQRTLLYTAITRARRVAVIVGSRQALGMAVRNAAAADRRCTLLAETLRRGGNPLSADGASPLSV
jgi:exodeoxyribonuclease V alpha subunit